MKPATASLIRSALARPGAALAAVAVTASVIVANPAEADLTLCNTTPNRIGVAIGYRGTGKGWTTEGWWNLPGETCETLYKGPLRNRYWYVHAVDYDGGGEWAGQSFMCTTDKMFIIRNARDCARQGYDRTGFFEVDVKDATDWTIRLIDPSEGGAKGK